MKPWYDRLHERFAATSLKKSETGDDIIKWKKFLARIKEPKDPIQASYIRYQCRMYYFSFFKKIVMNVFGFGALFIEFFYMLMAKDHDHKAIKGKAIIERARDIPDFSDIAPEEVLKGHEQLVVIENFNKKFAPLCKDARKILLDCIRAYPFSFFFVYFVYMELATHSEILLNHNPEFVYVYINERNIASPIITALYAKEGRKFCSFMHGEYTLQLIMAFMKFSVYYVWDESYIDMFEKDLRCQIEQYIVYTPKKLQKKWSLSDIPPTYFCTYYFSGGSEEAFTKVADLLLELHDHGKKCSVRPHPRDIVHRKMLEDSFVGTDISVENAHELSLEESLARTKYVIGLQSTVLSEAYIEGKEIVLDDLSDQERFDVLKSPKFNVFNKPHVLFSELMKQNIDQE